MTGVKTRPNPSAHAENDPGQQAPGVRGPEAAYQPRHAPRAPPDMQHHQQPDPALHADQPHQPRPRIKQGRVWVADQGHADKLVRVPQRQFAILQRLANVLLEWIKHRL